ncbi:hypothetical protein CIP101352_01830 [Corynebacterium diphtheriae]|nr:hypothetical protein CIP101352_01830 [Corynebacterium diphtheriae]
MGALIGVIAGLVVNVLGFLLSNLPSVAQVFCGAQGTARQASGGARVDRVIFVAISHQIQ